MLGHMSLTGLALYHGFSNTSVEEVTVIRRLVWLDVIVQLVPDKDDVLRLVCLVDTLPDHLEDDPDPPVEGEQVGVKEDGRHRVHGQGPSHGGGEGHRTGVVGQQRAQGRAPDHAALVEWSQDGKLVVVRTPEPAPVVQVDRERVVSKRLECLVMMPVHVPHQEVEHV